MADKRPSVAIVGGGSAGTNAAHRLHTLFEGAIDLVVYERAEHVGGRAWDVEFAGTRLEIGGTVLHSTGEHTMALMALTGAAEATYTEGADGEETYAFWTDHGFPIHTKSSLASLAWGILTHVGPFSALRVTTDARTMAEKWGRVYEYQTAQVAFATPDGLLAALGLDAVTKVSIADHLRARRVNRRMIDDVVVPIIHNMYNQGGELNAFAGQVGLAGAGFAGGYLFSVEGGNRTLFARALDALGVPVRLSSPVTALTRRGATWQVTTAAGTDEFDAVILAAPPALADLEISIDDAPLPIAAHPYQEVHTTFVVGRPDPAYFGADPTRRFPSHVFVADSAQAPFMSLGITGYSPVHQQKIYKLFSATTELSDAVLHEIFVEVTDVYRWVWRGAYPVLTPGIEHLPFELGPGLFFAGAFETAAGAIEVEAVGGVNAAILAATHLGWRGEASLDAEPSQR